MTKCKAKIVRVAEGGVAYADNPEMQNLSGFSFEKIVGYKGQSAKELGLKPGRIVTIEYDAQNLVAAVTL